MPTGKVKWFNAEKGFGFLAEDDGEDVFVHRDALPSGVTELKPGQRVEFGIVQGRKGNQALQVRLLEPMPSVVKATRRPPLEVTLLEHRFGTVATPSGKGAYYLPSLCKQKVIFDDLDRLLERYA